MPYKTFRELIAWQKAMDLVLAVYQLSKSFPSEEKYGLTSQIRRAAVSIPSNIAEGHGRQSSRDFVKFLRIANASIGEVETQAELAERLDYATADSVNQLLTSCEEVGRVTRGLIASINQTD